jgi:hypothetical protein
LSFSGVLRAAAFLFPIFNFFATDLRRSVRVLGLFYIAPFSFQYRDRAPPAGRGLRAAKAGGMKTGPAFATHGPRCALPSLSTSLFLSAGHPQRGARFRTPANRRGNWMSA